MRTTRPRRRPPAALLLLVSLTVAIGGCTMIEDAPPAPRAARADRAFDIQVPRIMRGTISSESIMLGYQPVLVRGYGLVVGLRGTGSGDIPPPVRAHMLAEMSRRGVGQETAGLGHLNPEQMLSSENTAVVIVEAIIPPGAVGRQTRRGAAMNGTPLDVRVTADPRTGTISLEGGRLYTAELRPSPTGETFPPTGSRQARALAEARGPIFVNPFADPTAIERDAINRSSGQILAGGEVVEDMPLKLRLASPSHARAEVIQNAVNTRFPREPGQSQETAKGLSGEEIRITVPPSYRSAPEDFVELLRHTSIRQSGVESIATSIKRIVVNDPSYAEAASWRFQALGPRAKPTIRELYDYPGELPRLAALRAGAMLDDPLVVPNLIDMATNGSEQSRREAVVLLRDMGNDPKIDMCLRALLNDDSVDIRIECYEALVVRGDPYIQRRVVDQKFVVDTVPSDLPMIYISETGQPRIGVFGNEITLNQPALADLWAGRLIVQSEANDKVIEVYYRDLDTGDATIEEVSPDLIEFISFLGHTSTVDSPSPGLGLRYSEVVSAVYGMWRQQLIAADFKAQQDRVLAAILRQRETPELEERPEFSDPDFDLIRPDVTETIDERGAPPAAPEGDQGGFYNLPPGPGS